MQPEQVTSLIEDKHTHNTEFDRKEMWEYTVNT